MWGPDCVLIAILCGEKTYIFGHALKVNSYVFQKTIARYTPLLATLSCSQDSGIVTRMLERVSDDTV